jgi:hypothetical protein
LLNHIDIQLEHDDDIDELTNEKFRIMISNERVFVNIEHEKITNDIHFSLIHLRNYDEEDDLKNAFYTKKIIDWLFN